MLNHLFPEKINVKDGKKKGLIDSVRPPFSSQNFITFQRQFQITAHQIRIVASLRHRNRLMARA